MKTSNNTMKVRFEASVEAIERFTMTNKTTMDHTVVLNEKYPVEAHMGEINNMCEVLTALSMPTKYNYLNEKEKELKSIGELIENVEYTNGFKKLADVAILTILYCAHHLIETFPKFKKNFSRPEGGKGPLPTCITVPLAQFASK
jgi:hypothetical protein